MSGVRQLRREDGFALPTAIIVLLIVMMLGIVALQVVNVQSHQTGHETAGEAAFNLSESALEAQAFDLEVAWPYSSSLAFGSCNQASTPSSTCPGTALTTSFNSTYAGPSFSNPVWKVQVIDDTGGSSYYSESLATNPVSWDSNGDNRVWLRAESTVWGQRKIVVAQMYRQLHTLSLPGNVITAGGVSTENNGSKVIVEATDPNSGLTGEVAVRCADSAQPSTGDPCLGWNQGQGQLDPKTAYMAGYTDQDGNYMTLSTNDLQHLKDTAMSLGSYYNGVCPTSLTGLVYVDNANCTYTGAQGGPWNSDSAPGALIFGSGTLTFNANVVYTGVIYMANGQGSIPSDGGPCTPSTPMNTVFTVHGGSMVNGAIFVDKCGTVDAGEAKSDVNYDLAAFAGVRAYSTPALAKNTFRIVPNG